MGGVARATAAVAVAALVAVALAAPAPAADDPERGDVRDLRLGLHVSELPGRGYVDFACGNDGGEPGTPLEGGWADYAQCPPEASGLHEVAFRYDDALQPWAKVNDNWEGTKLAGHPVILSLLIDDGGVVQGIRAVTDPDARMYMKKKAYLLTLRVKGRYGRDGWSCRQEQPVGGRSPVGGVFIDEVCEKDYNGRHLVVRTNLYRTAEQSGRDFTNSTRFEILSSSAS